MHVIESIGPVLGIVAFVGLAVLAFLLFQQARDIRRLREWAGRAPERAAEAADAVQAVADASRDEEGEPEAPVEEPPPGRLRGAWERVSWGIRDRFAAVDRRLPVDGRYLLAILLVAVIAAGVVTSGFGLVGGDDGGRKGGGSKPQATVAVLNGTSVQGLAALVEKQVVKRAGYKEGPVGNTASTFNATVIEYANGERNAAKGLANAVKRDLGETPVQPMTSDVREIAGKAELAIILGLDDAGFGGGG
jgi:hypothetical protein